MNTLFLTSCLDSDISVAQWLGLTPRQIVKDHLNLPDAVIDSLPKYEQFIVPGDTNMTATNFTRFQATSGELKGSGGLKKRGDGRVAVEFDG